MSKQTLWFTRRDKEIRGPFPTQLITRFILLGRVVETDFLSKDQYNWAPVSQFPDLIPPEMKADLSIPENKERLRLARMREDERKAGDRRQTADEDLPDDIRRRRSGDERRDSETIEILRHREIKTETAQIIAAKRHSQRAAYVLVAALISVIVGIAWISTPNGQVSINNCNAPPQPAVNWNNCRMEGVKLASSDLRRARLQNAYLNGADLRGVNLANASMSYANLANAIVENSNLSESKLVGAVLRKSNLRGANLKNADLKFAILHEVDLTNADLSHADLSHVVLNGAILSNTNLTGAILDKAIWIDNSVCAPESVGKCIPVQPAQ